MKRNTLNALRSSILHWKRMANGKAKNGEIPSNEDCALCTLFNHRGMKPGTRCVGCPASLNQIESLCFGTPYAKAYDAWSKYGINSAQFRIAAKVELEFLESLLPAKP